MSIIVAQKFAEINEEIKKKLSEINPGKEKKVGFTTNPMEALNILDAFSGDKGHLIVLGEFFDHPFTGLDLAREIKAKFPRAIIFMYSTTPVASGLIDGYIPKNSQTVIAEAHILVAAIISYYENGLIAQDLKKKFSRIKTESPCW
jgi:hypothetical protein